MFVWSIENNTTDDLDVSITFTYKNGQGDKEDTAGGVWNEPFTTSHDTHHTHGVMIHQQFRGNKCTHALTAKVKVNTTYSCHTCHTLDMLNSGSRMTMPYQSVLRYSDTCPSSQR